MAALGTRDLTLTIGGTDYTATVTNCRITTAAGETDVTTFADAKAGGTRVYALAFTMIQDPSALSLWDKIWTAAGTTVAVVVSPAGGTTASATQPKFSGNVTITEPDGDLLGGEANASTSARFLTEVSWVFAAKPTRALA